MKVTVKIDASTTRGKALIKELRRYPKTVTFEKQDLEMAAPDGYMTLEEFREESKKSLKKILVDNGLYKSPSQD